MTTAHMSLAYFIEEIKRSMEDDGTWQAHIQHELDKHGNPVELQHLKELIVLLTNESYERGKWWGKYVSSKV